MGDGGGEGEDEVQFLRTVRFLSGSGGFGCFLANFSESLSVSSLLCWWSLKSEVILSFRLFSF